MVLCFRLGFWLGLLLFEGAGGDETEGDDSDEIYERDKQKEDPEPAEAGVAKSSDNQDSKKGREDYKYDQFDGVLVIEKRA